MIHQSDFSALDAMGRRLVREMRVRLWALVIMAFAFGMALGGSIW